MRPDEITTIFIRRVLSVAETGEVEWKPGAVYIYNDDNRFNPPRKQITLAIGYTEGGGNLKTVLQRYIDKGGQDGRLFTRYMAKMGSKNQPTLANSKPFVNLLKDAGKDPVMRKAQEECFDELYLGPAFAWAEKHGFQEPLSYLVIADSFLHSGSMMPFLMNRFAEKKPIDGGDEKKWIKSYLDARHQWLRNHSNSILNGTVYRADAYLREIAKNNWDLSTGSLVMNGTPIDRLA